MILPTDIFLPSPIQYAPDYEEATGSAITVFIRLTRAAAREFHISSSRCKSNQYAAQPKDLHLILCRVSTLPGDFILTDENLYPFSNSRLVTRAAAKPTKYEVAR